jgi:hypothetical protein
MGNNKSSHASTSHESHHQHKHQRHAEAGPNALVKQIFMAVSDGGDTLSLPQLKYKFGELAVPLFKYLSDDDETLSPMSLEQFGKHSQGLVGSSTDIYVKIIQPVEELLKVCFDCAGVPQPKHDDLFIKSLIEDMTSEGSSYDKIISWQHANCPGLCTSIREKVFDVFYDRQHVNNEYKSDILTPSAMYILQGMLPRTIYFPQNRSDIKDLNGSLWTLLYSSDQQGISMNRFETTTFHYKGPTVVIFRKTDHSVFVIANDEEWRHSTKKFGGNNCLLVQILPEFKRVDGNEMIYCNFKLRSSVFGIMFGRHFSVNDDMSDVSSLEVWGCGDDNILLEQQKQKLRLKRAAEQKGTVPLPGNWDENPDKSILEMAGIKFSTEQRDDRPPDER